VPDGIKLAALTELSGRAWDLPSIEPADLRKKE
jgi:hypothetical protein